MIVAAIRFRSEDDVVVLQVGSRPSDDSYGYDRERPMEWRDAKVTDLLEVARYTRAYDALDTQLQAMGESVREVSDMLRRQAHKVDE